MTKDNKFFETIKKYSMLSPGDDVLVGFSGGADSTCLLSLLYENRLALGISVRAAHINHGLRGEEADRDELFARKFCEERNIPISVLRADVNSVSKERGISTELAGREVRYAFFNSLSPSKIATAHTGSDAAETLLMNISRGASLKGLCSIPPVRGNVIRPLIEFTREETENYCAENSIPFVTDSSNAENSYTRNKFRNNVISQIKKIEPSFENAALRCIDSVRIENDFIEQNADKYYRELFEDNSLCVSGFSDIHKAIRLRLIARFIAENAGADYEMRHLTLLDDNIAVSGFALTLPGGKTVKTDGKNLFIAKKSDGKVIKEEVFLKKDELNKKLSYNGYNLELKLSDDGSNKRNAVDFFKIDDIIIIRSRREGDKITLSGRKCTKTLKKLFNEMKIPVEERDRIPVVADKNGIIFVPFAGTDAHRAPGAKTEKFLIINAEIGKNE
ncbi:MAG: tRNA lysidine(34) synthetase TilS [Oscillospiraceae bacterium]|nr:tRNA lysidine(34) synthetase TilS [Oscillospiraceae bacterium]